MKRATLTKNPGDVSSMFDEVASKYDVTNTVLTGGLIYVWRSAVKQALEITPGKRILDLAAGTGSSSKVYQDAGAEVICCDFSVGMMTTGQERHPDLTFIAGDGMALPFADETFDAVTISYGMRNIKDSDQALRELYRVTKPGGTLVVCEFSRPTNKVFRELYNFYLGKVMPAITRRVSSDAVAYDYLMESILKWPPQEEFAERVQAAGWRDVEYRNITNGVVALHRATRPL